MIINHTQSLCVFYFVFFFLVSFITTGQAQSQYYFIFKARGIGETYRDCRGETQRSITGHAFVSLLRQDQALQQSVIDSTWGFVPNKRGIMALISTPGHTEITCLGDLGTVDFAVKVDQVTYEYAKNLKSKWVTRKYGIFDNVNCVDFVRAMLDLVTPDVKMPPELKPQWFPKPFLDKIKELNPDRDIAARQAIANPNVRRNRADVSLTTTPRERLAESKNTPAQQPTSAQKFNLLGGTTPEALGRIMLKALQNNDLNIWMNCIHPIASERDRELMGIRFNQFRQELNEEGLTDWSQVRFSRVTFKTATNVTTPGIGNAANLVDIEFLYKNEEYVGNVTAGVFATEPNKNIYYVFKAPLQSVSLRRSKSK